MTTKNCAKCNAVFEYTPVVGYPDKRKYCDPCKLANDAAYIASKAALVPQQIPAVPVPVNAPVQKIPASSNTVEKETGTFQSTVWNHSVAPHVYKVGIEPRAGQEFSKHEIHYEDVEDLKEHLQKLRDAGLMDLPLNQLPRD